MSRVDQCTGIARCFFQSIRLVANLDLQPLVSGHLPGTCLKLYLLFHKMFRLFSQPGMNFHNLQSSLLFEARQDLADGQRVMSMR